MQLSKDTWHYRNFEAWQKKTRTIRNADLLPPHNRRNIAWVHHGDKPARQPDLCTYTRIVLLYGPAYRLGGWLHRHDWVAPALMLTFLYGFFVVYGYAVAAEEGYSGWWFPWLVVPAVVFGMVAVAFAGIAGFFFTLDKIKNRRRRARSQPSEPNVIGEYLKARKSKVCPIIEFKEQ